MLVTIVFFSIIVIYIIYAYLKSSTYKELIKLISTIIAFLLAYFLNVAVASLISNHIPLFQINNNVNILLGIEILYYKIVAFIFVFIVVFVILYVILTAINLRNIVRINNHVVTRLLLGLVVVYVWATVLLNIFLATPYGYTIASNSSYVIANAVGVGTMMDNISYEYQDIAAISNDNSNMSNGALNISILREYEKHDYATKAEMKKILNNFDNYNESVKKYLESE